MRTLRGRTWAWLRTALDDSLPMPAEEREERDWTPASDEQRTRGRLQRFRLRLLEKRGKGGSR